MRPLAVSVLRKLINPLVSIPWDYNETLLPGEIPGRLRLREMVLDCVKARQFESDSFSAQDEQDCFPDPDLNWHARRIAYLMHHGWGDALTLNLGLAKSGQPFKARLEDGYHRLCAAILLEHEFVMVDPLGSVSLIDDLFGPDAPELEPEDLVVVSAGRTTVWCHALDGSTVGRFDWRYGLDVHTTVTSQLAGANQCLHCTHEPATAQDWDTFCEKMWRHHAIYVDKELMAASCPVETEPMEVPCG